LQEDGVRGRSGRRRKEAAPRRPGRRRRLERVRARRGSVESGLRGRVWVEADTRQAVAADVADGAAGCGDSSGSIAVTG